MSNQIKIQTQGVDSVLSVKKDTLKVGGTRLVVEDIIPLFRPWQGERILWIARTNAYYSVVPLFNRRHRLLCFTFCEDALKKYKPTPFYHALVLGCGGGAVPRWLLEEYASLSVDVVDYSPDILAVCRKYFLKKWEKSDRLTYYCQDARDYEPPDYDYQFIFCDLFDGQNLAPVVLSPVFAAKLRRMLGENGLLLINCGWHHLEQVQAIYQPLFGNIQIVDRESWQTEVVLIKFH